MILDAGSPATVDVDSVPIVAHAIEEILAPRGVGVVIDAVHLCMMMRGVEKQNSRTITSALRGRFRECPMTRDEFLRLAHREG